MIDPEIVSGILRASRRRPAGDAQSYAVGESETDGSSETEGIEEGEAEG